MCGWFRVLCHASDLFRVRLHLPALDDVSQETPWTSTRLTFLLFSISLWRMWWTRKTSMGQTWEKMRISSGAQTQGDWDRLARQCLPELEKQQDHRCDQCNTRYQLTVWGVSRRLFSICLPPPFCTDGMSTQVSAKSSPWSLTLSLSLSVVWPLSSDFEKSRGIEILNCWCQSAHRVCHESWWWRCGFISDLKSLMAFMASLVSDSIIANLPSIYTELTLSWKPMRLMDLRIPNAQWLRTVSILVLMAKEYKQRSKSIDGLLGLSTRPTKSNKT